jgi:hypothetical protein
MSRFDGIAGKCLNRLPRLPKRERHKMSDVFLDSAQNPRASISQVPGENRLVSRLD